MNVDLTRPEIKAIIYATSSFIESNGSGDVVRDVSMRKAEHKLLLVLAKFVSQEQKLKYQERKLIATLKAQEIQEQK